MYKIRRQLRDFCAAHRLINGYQGKCQHLHGHNYAVSVTIGCPSLNEYGFVEDFSLVKALLDEWLQQHWDHVTLVLATDKPLLTFLQQEQMRYFVIDHAPNTTAEVLAKYLFDMFSGILSRHRSDLRLLEVELSETPNSKAIYHGSGA